MRFILVLILLVAPYWAEAKFYHERERGWFNFEQKEIKEELEEEEFKELNNVLSNPNVTATEKVKAITADLTEKRSQLILSPTQKNAATYKDAELRLAKQGSMVGDAFQRLQYTNPKYDDSINNPINQQAMFVKHDITAEKRKAMLHKMSKDYGLYFFFRGDCAYCHRQAPWIKSFAQEYGFELMAISIDGGTTKSFPAAVKNNGMAEMLNLQNVPALIALNKKTNEFIPMSYGMKSKDEITEIAAFLLGEKE